MYSRILTCDYEFVSPWWDEVSLNAKDLVSEAAPERRAAECEPPEQRLRRRQNSGRLSSEAFLCV